MVLRYNSEWVHCRHPNSICKIDYFNFINKNNLSINTKLKQ